MVAENFSSTKDTTSVESTHSAFSQSLFQDLDKDFDAVRKVLSDLSSRSQATELLGHLPACEIVQHEASTDSTSPKTVQREAPTDSTSPKTVQHEAPTDSTSPKTVQREAPTDSASPQTDQHEASAKPSLSKILEQTATADVAPTQIMPFIVSGDSTLSGMLQHGATADSAVALSVSDQSPSLFTHPIDFLEHLYHKLADKPSEPAEKPPESTPAPQESHEKSHLKELESKLDAKDRTQFEKDMADFEKRAAAATPPLSQAEVDKTYAQISRLIESDKSITGISQDQRIKIAEQVMYAVAHPTETDQGNHNTCGAASLESKLLTTNPSEVAKLIADVTITGEYHSKTGKTIHPNLATLTATNPDGHDYDYPPKSGSMDQAGRIFQVTAVTMEESTYVQGTPKPPEDDAKAKQKSKDKEPPDTGEKIKVRNPDNPFESHEEKFTGLSNDQMQDMGKEITGKDMSDQIVVNAAFAPDSPDGKTYCSSPEDLGDKLAHLKAEGKLPAVIQVNCVNEPFYTDSKGVTTGSSEWHYVTVTDYESGPPAKVSIDNQWGKSLDHSGDRSVPLDQLYTATLEPGGHEIITELNKELSNAKKDGNATTEIELELARQRHIANDPHEKISNQEYEKESRNIMVNAMKRWEKEEGNGTLSDQERKEAWIKFINMLGDMPSEDPGTKKLREDVVSALQASQKRHHNLPNPALVYKEYREHLDSN